MNSYYIVLLSASLHTSSAESVERLGRILAPMVEHTGIYAFNALNAVHNMHCISQDC